VLAPPSAGTLPSAADDCAGAPSAARDRTGCTPLHFAAVADARVADAVGRTADVVEVVGAVGSASDAEDEESRWGDAEEESDAEVVVRRRRRARRPDPPLRAPSSSEDETRAPADKATDEKRAHADEKRVHADEKRGGTGGKRERAAADWLLDALQRRFVPAGGLLPQWPALPVFPTFRQGDAGVDALLAPQEWRAVLAPQEWRALLTAQDWRAYWDKWLLLARAAPHAVHEHDEPPPRYTPCTEDAVEVRGAKGKGKERARRGGAGCGRTGACRGPVGAGARDAARGVPGDAAGIPAGDAAGIPARGRRVRLSAEPGAGRSDPAEGCVAFYF
jgi:hypothetical protein